LRKIGNAIKTRKLSKRPALCDSAAASPISALSWLAAKYGVNEGSVIAAVAANVSFNIASMAAGNNATIYYRICASLSMRKCFQNSKWRKNVEALKPEISASRRRSRRSRIPSAKIDRSYININARAYAVGMRAKQHIGNGWNQALTWNQENIVKSWLSWSVSEVINIERSISNKSSKSKINVKCRSESEHLKRNEARKVWRRKGETRNIFAWNISAARRSEG
jgi:hypothetical protein